MQKTKRVKGKLGARDLKGDHRGHGKSKGQRIAPRIRTFTVPTTTAHAVIGTVVTRCTFIGGCESETNGGARCGEHLRVLPPLVTTSDVIRWHLPKENRRNAR